MEEQKKKKSGVKVWIVLIILILIATVGGLVYYIVLQNAKIEEQATKLSKFETPTPINVEIIDGQKTNKENKKDSKVNSKSTDDETGLNVQTKINADYSEATASDYDKAYNVSLSNGEKVSFGIKFIKEISVFPTSTGDYTKGSIVSVDVIYKNKRVYSDANFFINYPFAELNVENSFDYYNFAGFETNYLAIIFKNDDTDTKGMHYLLLLDMATGDFVEKVELQSFESTFFKSKADKLNYTVYENCIIFYERLDSTAKKDDTSGIVVNGVTYKVGKYKLTFKNKVNKKLIYIYNEEEMDW